MEDENRKDRNLDNENLRYLLKAMRFDELQPITGHQSRIEIQAGLVHYINIEISIPNSIICINF